MTFSELSNSSMIHISLLSRGLSDEEIKSVIQTSGDYAITTYSSKDDIIEWLFIAARAKYGEHYSLNDLVNLNIKDYLIIEDTASGMDFWKSIIDNCGLKLNLINPTMLGRLSGGLENLYRGLSTTLATSNIYYILPDMDDTNREPRYHKVIRELRNLCESTSNYTLLSEYTCFESIFLGFSDLVNWAKSFNTMSDTLDEEDMVFIHELHNRLRGTTYNTEAYIALRYKYRKDKSVTWETDEVFQQLASDEELCSILLRKLFSARRSKIDKKHIGDCWWSTCCTLAHEACDMLYSQYINKLYHIFVNSYFKGLKVIPNDLCIQGETS